MKVELLYFDGCPNYETVLAELRRLLARGGVEVEPEPRRIESAGEAERERFLGSPTVRVNGTDVEPGAAARTDFGLKCRLYRTAAGLRGAPPEAWIAAALRPATAVHWRGVYGRTDPDRLSWHESEPRRSLELIESARLPAEAAILDLGGGTSSLAARLVDAGYADVTVADISAAALERARADCGSFAARITWLEADVRTHRFGRRYDLWHDRAVFHFMVAPADREAYLEALRRTLRPGGHLVIATFGPEGPERCSGLPVARYDAGGLAAALGAEFAPISSGLGLHRTPSGAAQQFLYAHFAYQPRPVADARS